MVRRPRSAPPRSIDLDCFNGGNARAASERASLQCFSPSVGLRVACVAIALGLHSALYAAVASLPAVSPQSTSEVEVMLIARGEDVPEDTREEHAQEVAPPPEPQLVAALEPTPPPEPTPPDVIALPEPSPVAAPVAQSPSPAPVLPSVPKPQVKKTASDAHRVGTAKADSKDTSAARATYAALVSAKIRANQFYPETARAQGITGHVVVVFTIGGAGAVTRAAISQSSGSGSLDDAARQAVRSIQLPPPPGGVFEASAPFKFGIR